MEHATLGSAVPQECGREGVRPGDRVLDLGCGGGRHAFELLRRGAHVVALDRNATDLAGAASTLAAMRTAGEARAGAAATALRADAYRLPLPDDAFDIVVAAEILEHLNDDERAIIEIARVVRPGGTVVVTVPRWWPERICWALSERYHTVDGGHGTQLNDRLCNASLVPTGTHHAHALHSPYWWLRCLFGSDNDRARLPRLYHRFLVYDIMRRPWWTRRLERLLNPLLGKCVVIYAAKPGTPQ